jgi:D-sedoheptulose 7-phosphate isomerase
MQEQIKKALADASQLLAVFDNEENLREIEKIAQVLAGCFGRENKVLICGNGGSNCDALHFAEEFTGRFRKERKPLPVISLSDSSHITCVANDFGFDEIFSRGVAAFGKKGDILIAISTSGNSENVIRAVKKGKKIGMKTIALLGKSGGSLRDTCDYQLLVEGKTTDRIQEIHMLALHIIIEMTERILFPENYEEV